MAWRCSASSNRALVNNLFNAKLASSEAVKSAMMNVDRKFYVPNKNEAYIDSPQAIGYNATISAPHMHAMCLEILEPCLKEGSTVLDVGCGSGYLTACLSYMVGSTGKVFGVDHIKGLVDLSVSNCKSGNPDIFDDEKCIFRVGDGRLGLEESAPFDAIHVGAAAPHIPQPLIDQLKKGGKMIIPVGIHDQELILVEKQLDGEITEKHITGVRYVPLTSERQQLSA